MARIGALVAIVAILAFHAVTSAVAGNQALRYRTDDGRALIVRGEACFAQEDVTQLRLVEYEGPDRVVYRCIAP